MFQFSLQPHCLGNPLEEPHTAHADMGGIDVGCHVYSSLGEGCGLGKGVVSVGEEGLIVEAINNTVGVTDIFHNGYRGLHVFL